MEPQTIYQPKSLSQTRRNRTKTCVYALAIIVAAYPRFARPAEINRVAKIGILLSSKQANVNSPTVVAFRQPLAERRWVEGENLLIEYRFAKGLREKYADLLNDLVRRKVEVIVATGGGSVAVAKRITKTIPIVTTNISDPVAAGLVASWSRPSTNVTGVASFTRNLSGKRLELLKESVVGLRRVAVLMDSKRPRTDFDKAHQAAAKLGIQVFSVFVRVPPDFAESFLTVKESRAGGIIVAISPLFNSNRKKLAQLASRHRVPAIYHDRRFVQDGGLMSYGPNISELFRRAAFYVDKILRGQKPADIPIERASAPEFTINLRAAKEIGLTIPPEVLLQANKVIR